MNFLEDVEGLGRVYRDYATPLEQVKAFNAAGIKAPVSVRDAAYIRLNGKLITSGMSTITCHAPICARDSPVIVARMSPLVQDLKMAEKLDHSHYMRNLFTFDYDRSIYAQWEKIAKQDASKKPEERMAIILDEREDFEIHRDSDVARFFFQDMRKPYFERFVLGHIIACCQIPIRHVDATSGTVADYVWFGDRANNSGISFDNLLWDQWFLGVLGKNL